MAIQYSERAKMKMNPQTSAGQFRAAEQPMKQLASAKPAQTPKKPVITPKKPAAPLKTTKTQGGVDIDSAVDSAAGGFVIKPIVWPGTGGGGGGAGASAKITSDYKTQKDYLEAIKGKAEADALQSLFQYVDTEDGDSIPLWKVPYQNLLGVLGGLKEDEAATTSAPYEIGRTTLGNLYGLTPSQFFSQLPDEGEDVFTPEQRRANFLRMVRQRSATPSAINPPVDGEPIDGEPIEEIVDDTVTLEDWLQTAQGQSYLGYENLRDYLEQNAPKAFAEATRATATPMANALAAYQAAQGVSSAPTDAAVALANVAAQGGAANYNNLLNVLQGLERSSGQARLGEAVMGQNLSSNRLNAALTKGLGALTQQEAAALAALSSRYGQQAFNIESQATQRLNTLMDKLSGLAGYGRVVEELKKLGVI